jgi:hypothetical protein
MQFEILDVSLLRKVYVVYVDWEEAQLISQNTTISVHHMEPAISPYGNTHLY